VIVAIGLLALVLLPVPAVRSVGYAGMLTPLISALAALTLLPVILATIGARGDWPHRRSGRLPDRGWSAWAGFVIRHRWPAMLGAAGILAVLGATALQLRVGQPDTASLAQSGPRRTRFTGSSAPAFRPAFSRRSRY
jgi:RND superfamily putative drug exporter